MSEPREKMSLLTAGQTKLFAVTLSCGCIFCLLLLTGWFVKTVGFLLTHFSSVFWPLAIAFILTIIFSPIVQLARAKFRWGKNFSIVALYISILVVGTVITWTLGGELIRQSKELISSSIDWPDRVETRIRQSMNPTTWGAVSESFSQFKENWKEALAALGPEVPKISKNSALVLHDAWTSLRDFFSSFASLAIVPVYLFYFLGFQRDSLDHLIGQFSFLSTTARADLLYLVRQFKEIIEAFFRGQLLIGALMGVGYALGFSLIGLKFGISLGLFFGILNIVPFLGSILGVITVFLVACLQPGGVFESGDWSLVWGCGLTFGIVQLFESYWLSPKVMGDRTGLHPVIIIISVFFWGTAFGGILGMILGIPLTTFLIVFWRLLRQKYFPA
jgi:predicted PurR-regulated permease PerM